jgi:RNA polymerase sigma-70 factor (sigma-E family)
VDNSGLDRVEFDAFVASRGAALLRLCYVLTGARAEAEDLLQEALARCYTRWSRISDLASVEAYVRRVIVTQHASAGRRRRFRLLDTSYPVAESRLAVADAADEVVSRETLRLALQRLPPRQRIVTVLTYYADLPDGEIATEMDCSVNTVKSHRAKALKALRLVLPVTVTTDPGDRHVG